MAAKGGRFIKYLSKIIQRSIRQDNQNPLKLFNKIIIRISEKNQKKTRMQFAKIKAKFLKVSSIFPARFSAAIIKGEGLQPSPFFDLVLLW